MKLEEGKYYITKHKVKFGPCERNPDVIAGSDYIYRMRKFEDENRGAIYTYTEDGVYNKGIPDDEWNIDREWVPNISSVKDIDQMTAQDYQRGIDKLWRMGRVF